MHTCLTFTLEIHHKKLELCSIQALPILGFLTKTQILEVQKNSNMIMKLLPAQRKLSRKLKLPLDLDHLLDISTQTMLESEPVMKNQLDKFTLKTKNSEMLNSKKLFSMERISRQSLEWLIHHLLRKTLLQFSMK